MDNLLKRFVTATRKPDVEPDWDLLRSRSMYPDLIGRKAPTDMPLVYWMRCGCGMMVMTSRELHGMDTVCANCKQNADNASSGRMQYTGPRHTTMRPQTERRILFGLVVFVMIAGGAIGARFMDAPPRAQADGQSMRAD